MMDYDIPADDDEEEEEVMDVDKMDVDKLEKLGACMEAVEWCADQPSLQAAWDTCERGDWMLWLLGRLSGEPWGSKRKRLAICYCEIARPMMRYVSDGEDRPAQCIEVVESWARGDGDTPDDVTHAAVAAADDAAYAAAHVDHVAHVADAAAYVAAADFAEFAATRSSVLREYADIVRRHYPNAPRF